MRYLVWVLRLVAFVIILMFALNNTGPVDVRFFADYTASGVPLIVVMLVMLILGTLLGWLIVLPSVLRYRRELARLRRAKVDMQQRIDRGATSQVTSRSSLVSS